MLRRIRQFLTLVSLILLIALLTLWADGHGLILRSVHRADARSHLFVQRGALQVDHTGLYYFLRDLGRADQIAIARDRIEQLPGPLPQAADEAGPFTFRWQSRFTRRTPLQDLTDAAGQPIYLEQSVPLKLLTVPAWLVAILLAIAPAWSIVRRVRRGRQAVLSPLRWPARHPVAVCTAATIAVSIGWQLSIVRPAAYYHARDIRHRVVTLDGKIEIGDYEPLIYDWQSSFIGESGILVEKADPVIWRLIGPVGYTVGSYGASHHLPFWMLFIIAAFVPMAWLAMRLWGRKHLEGHCPNCDYDLRFSTDRCPECGRPIDAVPPRIGRQRVQATRFALAAILLMLAGVLLAAWTQDADLFLSGDPSNRATWATVNDGQLSAHRGRRSVAIRSSILVPTQLISLPVWIPTAGLLLASAGVFWAAIGAGRVRPH